MLITVAICTRNRAGPLDRTLASLAGLKDPSSARWELLVIDNGSSDRTADVIDAWRERLPLRKVTEPAPGLSNARNRAAAEASGAWLVWTDDDVDVEPDWLVAYVAAFMRHPDAVLFGGPVGAAFQGTPPRWLPHVVARVPGAWAVRQLGSAPFQLEAALDRLPFGANYAVKATTQLDHPYDPALGVRPGRFVRGEETAVMLSILAAGGTGWWVPDAKVTHRIGPDRQTIRYLRSYYRLDASARRDGDSVSLFRALRAELKYRTLRAVAPPERWIGPLITASEAWGLRDAADGASTGSAARQ